MPETLTATTHADAGDYPTDAWSFDGGTNYLSDSGTVHDHINKISAHPVVTGYSVNYDGTAHTATFSSDGGVGTFDVSATTHTDAGDYPTDAWSFDGGTNYLSDSGTVHDHINKISAHPVVTGYTVDYDGSPHTATGTSDGNVGTFTLTGTTHTNAGDYPTDAWSFDGGTNYLSDSGTVHDHINKANATVVVTAYTVTYNGLSHTATYTITGVNGETGATVGTVTLNTTHTNAGTYSSDTWSFTGSANYNNIASTTITDTINRANATVVVTTYNVTYDGHSHTATYTITGVNGETGAAVGTVTLNTTHTNAGTYSTDSWSFTGTANYNNIASMTVTDTINKANATVVVTAYHVPYDNQPHTATYTINGVNGETGNAVGTINVTGTTHTSPGDYPSDPWTFTGTANYNNTSGTVHDSIGYGACTGSDPGGVILPPINTDGSSVYKRKAGSTIPVKFKVCDVNGNSISDPNAVFLTGCCGSVTMTSRLRGTVDTVNEVGTTDIPDVAFHYVGDKWQFNMDTGTLDAGYTYTFRINLKYGNITFTVATK